jgi:hypothetical protein
VQGGGDEDALCIALADPVGVRAHRASALERVAFLLADWQVVFDVPHKVDG